MTDDHLDRASRRLLDQIDQLRRLERQRRDTDRTSDAYLPLAQLVEDQARFVFEMAGRHPHTQPGMEADRDDGEGTAPA